MRRILYERTGNLWKGWIYESKRTIEIRRLQSHHLKLMGLQSPYFKPKMLLDKLGMEMDLAKNRYYMLLDELF